jgi:tetratricopeptide (TPR) repeat protein/tRNA A-37 threonylcarbamoyl transferase component Bud32
LATPSFVGGKLGHFRILEKLGEGGMGVVYRAYDENLQREVALKVLRNDPHEDGLARTRMRREALALAQLNHPNIATVYDFESDGPVDFVVLEYVSGESLAHLIRQHPLELERLLALGHEIADAVEQAHVNGIIHCDLKPSNIVLTEDFHAKVLDFGLARLFRGFGESTTAATATGSSGGTLPYMAPEQLSGKVDIRSDIYAIGTVLFEMATGRRAFLQEHFADLVEAILHERPPLASSLNKEIPPSLDVIIAKAMAKNPVDRYQTAAELRDDLLRLSAGVPIIAKAPPTPWSVTWRWVTSIAVISVIALVVLPYLRKVQAPGIASANRAHIVAVLPFESVGGLPDDEALCRGLTEALTANLAQQSRRFGWEVVPAAEVRSQGIKDADQARRILGANLVVEGTWQFKGARQVAYGLVDSANRRHVDATVVRADGEDYFSLEGEVFNGALRMLAGETALATLEGQKYRPKDPKAYQDYLRARGYLQSYQQPGSVDSALGLLTSATKLDPEFALAHASLAEASWKKYVETKDPKWVSAAQASVTRAAALAPEASEVLSAQGLIDQGTGKYEKAVAEYERAVALNPTDDAAFRGLANSYRSLGNQPEAERAYRRAWELRKDAPGGYAALGAYLFSLGRYKEAEPLFQRVIELAPENPKAYANLGGVYVALGNYSKARANFEKSISIAPNWNAYSNLGTLNYMDQRFSDAAQAYEKALAIDNRDTRLWHNLAASYYWVPGQRDKSRATYEHVKEMITERLKVNPRDADLIMLLADCEVMLDNNAHAQELAKRSMQLSPDSVENMLIAAELYDKVGKRDEALGYVKRALGKGFSRDELSRSAGLKDLRTDPRYKALLSNSR